MSMTKYGTEPSEGQQYPEDDKGVKTAEDFKAHEDAPVNPLPGRNLRRVSSIGRPPVDRSRWMGEHDG